MIRETWFSTYLSVFHWFGFKPTQLRESTFIFNFIYSSVLQLLLVSWCVWTVGNKFIIFKNDLPDACLVGWFSAARCQQLQMDISRRVGAGKGENVLPKTTTGYSSLLTCASCILAVCQYICIGNVHIAVCVWTSLLDWLDLLKLPLAL